MTKPIISGSSKIEQGGSSIDLGIGLRPYTPPNETPLSRKDLEKKLAELSKPKKIKVNWWVPTAKPKA